MAASTVRQIIGSTWTQVAANATFVAVQVPSHGNLLVHVGEAAVPPAANSNDGLVIGWGLDQMARTFSAGGLPPDTAVWLKSEGDPVPAVVVTY